ncbi:MAG TPA: hypothetical protein VL832_05995 [Puia sp.]|jgi:hypothetical protein|nr:hypothetical protein [Puia sp.]
MKESSSLLITTTVTILLAFIGYLVKYFNDLALARRKDKLDRINKQLGDLYGPLYSLLKSNEQAWASFRKTYKPGGAYFDPLNPPNDEQLAAWRHYMKVVFMPANEKIYDVIVSKSDLLIENDMPACLLKLISHIVVYKAVIKNWELGKIEENTSIINFPDDAREYVYASFEKLKKEQFQYLHKRSV